MKGEELSFIVISTNIFTEGCVSFSNDHPGKKKRKKRRHTTIIIIFILSYVFRFFKQKRKKKSKIEAMILFFDKLKT